MWRDKARLGIYALAGVYLLSLVYEMYRQLSTAGSNRTIMIVFMVFFAICGVMLIGFSLWAMRKKK